MIQTFFYEILSGIITTVMVAIIIARLYRPNIIYGFPYNSFFNIEEVGKFQINTVFVSNTGKKEAEDVCIFFNKKPDHFIISPAIEYEIKEAKNKPFLLKIPFLPAKNMFLVQLFSYRDIPDFKGIRVKTGKVRQINMIPQPQYSKKYTYLAAILILLGLATSIYLLLMFLSKYVNLDIKAIFY